VGDVVLGVVPRDHLALNAVAIVGATGEDVDFVKGDPLDRNPRGGLGGAIGFVSVHAGEAGFGLANVDHAPSPAQGIDPAPENGGNVLKAFQPHFTNLALSLLQTISTKKSIAFA